MHKFRNIFKLITYSKEEVRIVFVKYKKPSVKDYEHRQRGGDDTCYESRRGNRRPAELSKLLRSQHFKEAFVQFLLNDWTNMISLYCVIEKLKINFDQCYIFKVTTGSKIKRRIDYNLSCHQEETDTKIVRNLC